MATRHYEGKKFNNNTIDKVVDALTVEEALQININDEPFTVSMRTPGNDTALVRGLLHAEGIIKNTSFKSDISIKDLAKLISKIVGFKGKMIFDKSKPDGTIRKLMDNTKLRRIIR